MNREMMPIGVLVWCLEKLLAFIGRKDIERFPVFGHGSSCDFDPASTVKDVGNLKISVRSLRIFVLHHLLDHILDPFRRNSFAFTLVNAAGEKIF